jgi:hypothetical protein
MGLPHKTKTAAAGRLATRLAESICLRWKRRRLLAQVGRRGPSTPGRALVALALAAQAGRCVRSCSW